MECGNDLGNQKGEPHTSQQSYKRCLGPQKEKGYAVSQEGPSQVIWKVKVRVCRNSFTLARFCCCNLTIVLVLMVHASCLDLKGWQRPKAGRMVDNSLCYFISLLWSEFHNRYVFGMSLICTTNTMRGWSPYGNFQFCSFIGKKLQVSY